MKQVSAKAVILSRTDYGEADRIITFLTPDQGKVRAMAKGVRKAKSKLAGGIELFSISDITYIEGKSELKTLVSTRLDKHFGDIVKDIDRTMLGYDMLKILSRVLEDEGGPEFYDLLVRSLMALDDLTAPKDLAEASYLLQLMRLLGHLPNFTHDIKGAEMTPNGHFQFSVDDMGFFEMPTGPFNQNHIKLLRLLSHNPPAMLKKVASLKEFLSDVIPIVRNMARQYVIPF
jgi:DNA repair protein RecO (recombination protein O)